ncbi:MAG TPA: methyltransferase domain-containing protein [Methylomirabilota bacterium]|nr:methyltransferase domain-containing protein [Methylomirabilota bacterium]
MLQALLRRYAEAQATAVAPFLVGRRVLDLGAGEAYVGAALTRRGGVSVCSADVGAFGRAGGAYAVYDGARLPFGDATFDTTLILLTLHHCAHAPRVLDEAVRVTRRRLVVVESVVRNPLDLFWLRLLDGPVNTLRHHGGMAPATRFRSPQEWRALFEARGLGCVAARRLGSRWERLVHHPLLWALDVQTTSSVREVASPKRPIE